MANLSFTAAARGGHVASLTIPARSSQTIDLQNASYNNVKVLPSIIFVVNSGNNGGVQITMYDLSTRLVPANTNYRVSVAAVGQVAIFNSGTAPVSIYVFDAAGEIATDITLALSGSLASSNDLLLHFEDRDYYNSGLEPMAITNGNPAANWGAASPLVKFGGVSRQFSGADQIDCFNAGYFAMSGDFTFDAWYYPTTLVLGRRYSVFSTSAAGVNNIVTLLLDASATRLVLVVNGVSTNSAAGLTWLNSYKHIAIVKKGSVWTVYLDGISIISVTNAYAAAQDNLVIGLVAGADFSFVGYVDEIRYSKGIADFTTNFTPPTVPYT